MFIKTSIHILLLAASLPAIGQSVLSITDSSLPRVFEIGEHEIAYEELQSDYQLSLIDACGGDMRIAHRKLSSMLSYLQNYAKDSGYNVDGIRIWMHIFWNTDGSIEHFAFHLRPNSRNVPVEEVKNFLSGFLEVYKFPQTASQPYMLYTSIAFPLAGRRLAER